MPKQPYPELGYRNGQWVRFELDENPKLLIPQPNNGYEFGLLDSKAELEVLIAKMQKSADGRFVGIYVAGGRFPDGNNGTTYVPSSIAPQRAILGAKGDQNIAWLYDGRAQTVLFALDSVRNTDPLLLREDCPAYYGGNPQWNPRP